MKCPDEKQMLLFFYNELKTPEKKLTEEHFLACSHCSGRYEKLSSFLNTVDRGKVDISQDNLNDILKQIEPSIKPVSILTRLQQKFSFVAEDILTALTRRPQVAVVALAIIAVISLLPVINKGKTELAREDVVDIEMELVFEDSNNTDVMLDIFNLNSSQKSSSTNISS
ncbi:MAG: hypothetical protein PHT53_01635 [Candidatus Omnitrophica bacterium]|nr:hypothetical protein [Candidatus Omnitrophota bacterium]